MPKRRINLTGQRFGKLMVLREGDSHIYKSNYVETNWICRCDCGKETRVRTKCLKRGATQSCGCSQQNAIKYLGDEASLRELHQEYRWGAKKRGFDFDLNIDQFRLLTSSNCHYCGASPSKLARTRKGLKIHYIYNGIDRVNNQVGYIETNCAPCCFICNRMKFQFSAEDFIEHAYKIVRHFEKIK